VFAAVVPRKRFRIAQPKVTRKINHFNLGGQTRRNLHGLSMRQSKKSAVEIVKTLNIFRRFDKFHLSQPEKIAMNIADAFAGMFIRGDELDFDIGMKHQNTDQFRTAVA
jgi:hypothetical protein